MRSRNFSLLLWSWLIAGCAAYDMPPLAKTHPAHAGAMVSQESPVSRTLAYTRADMPSRQPVMAQAVKQEGRVGALAAAAAPQSVEGEGKVVATVPSSRQIIVEHGEIKGFMDAMTMGYRTEPASLLEGLKFGDRIRFTIDVANKAIVKIEKIK